jgi:hypothetical protein
MERCNPQCKSQEFRVQRTAKYLYCRKRGPYVCEEIALELFQDGRYFVWPADKKKSETSPKLNGSVWWYPIDK